MTCTDCPTPEQCKGAPRCVGVGGYAPRLGTSNDAASAVANKLREIAVGFGGSETGDGLLLLCLSDAIEHGDAMDELNGMTLAIVPVRPKQ